MLFSNLMPLEKCIVTDLGSLKLSPFSIGYIVNSSLYTCGRSITKLILTRVGKGGKPRCDVVEQYTCSILTSSVERINYPVIFSEKSRENVLTMPIHEFVGWAGAWALLLQDKLGHTSIWRNLKDPELTPILLTCTNDDLVTWKHNFETVEQRSNIVNKLRYISQFMRITLNITQDKESLLRKSLLDKYRGVRNRQKKGDNVDTEIRILKQVVAANLTVDTSTSDFKRIFVETDNVVQQYKNSGYWL